MTQPDIPDLTAGRFALKSPGQWGLILLLILTLLVGIYARFTELEGHFTHLDDIGVAKYLLDQQISGGNDPFLISRHWTYAPFQFLFTRHLIHPDQPYRDLLFWGRLPSCVFSILGLLAFMAFFFVYDRALTAKALFALTLLACSWEHIIFAKQMHNYALGVTAAIGVMTLYVWHLRPGHLSTGRMAFSGLMLALLVSMQYSILFFVPAFYVGLAIFAWRQGSQRRFHALSLLISMVLFLAAVFPLWAVFLKKYSAGRAIGWNEGLNAMFRFQIADGAGFGDTIVSIVKFFTLNWALIFQTLTALTPRDHILFWPISILLGALFVAGVFRFFRTEHGPQRYLGLFAFGLFVTWTGLVVTQRLTLSPTRHSLILLPLIALITAEGWGVFGHKPFPKARRGWPWPRQDLAITGVALGLLLIFTLNYGIFLEQRRDPFDEEEIVGLLKEYQVDSVVSVLWTLQGGMMKSVRDRYQHHLPGLAAHEMICGAADPSHPRRIAWISHREALSPTTFSRHQQLVNNLSGLINASGLRRQQNKAPLPLIRGTYSDYRVLYQKEIPSNVEIEYGNLTQDGSNGYYFYILEDIRTR